MKALGRAASIVALVLWLPRCDEPARVVPVNERVPTPARADRGRTCADVASVRACWDPHASSDACTKGVCLVEREDPWKTTGGWRCAGSGDQRTCEPRARSRPPMACDEERCVQAHPRVPDDGEWECAELAGVVVCHGGAEAAAVVSGRPDPAWTCGERRGTTPPERVCLDAAPDVPSAEDGAAPGPYRCGFDRRYGVQRVCTRVHRDDRAGARCSGGTDCAAGLACAGGRCLPVAWDPSCWLDEDCGEGARCRIGSCVVAE